MKKACVLGHFGFGKELLNGQTVKTKMVADELEAIGNARGLVISTMHEDIFNTMHHI